MLGAWKPHGQTYNILMGDQFISLFCTLNMAAYCYSINRHFAERQALHRLSVYMWMCQSAITQLSNYNISYP